MVLKLCYKLRYLGIPLPKLEAIKAVWVKGYRKIRIFRQYTVYLLDCFSFCVVHVFVLFVLYSSVTA